MLLKSIVINRLVFEFYMNCFVPYIDFLDDGVYFDAVIDNERLVALW